MQRLDDVNVYSGPYGQIDPLPGFSRSDRAIVARTWEQQAADALPGPGRHPHQSQSVAFAVRAAEAFAPFNSSHSHAAEADAPLSASPHPDRTAVCCQLLRELMQVCPELASPLGRIRDALGQALYSNYYAASDGTLELKQLPFFTVVQRLELEKTNLQQKYEDSKTITAAQEEHAQELAWQLSEARRHTGEAMRERDQLKMEIEQDLQAVKDAKGEAAAAREELRGARKDLLQFRNEGNSLRALYDIANAKAMEQSAQSDQRIAALRTQLADAVGQLAEMAPISELQSARQQTEAARNEVSDLEGQLDDLQGQLAALQDEHSEAQQEAEAQIHELETQIDESCISSAQQLAQVAALLPPDPEPWPFALEVLESTGCTFAVGLGLGSSVPVFLRWSGKLALHTYSPEETGALIQSIQQDHTASEQSLHKHLFHIFWDPVLAACSKLTSVCSNYSTTAVQHGRNSLSAIQSEAASSKNLEECRSTVDQLNAAKLESARAAYSLVHAAVQAAPQSTEARQFVCHLKGELGSLPSDLLTNPSAITSVHE